MMSGLSGHDVIKLDGPKVAQNVIPAKRGRKTWRVHGVRAEMRWAFPQRLYRRRSLRTQMRQALLLGLSFNLYRLKHRGLFLRMSTEPDNF